MISRMVQIGKRMESLGWLRGFAVFPSGQFQPTFTDLGKERIKSLFAISRRIPMAMADHQVTSIRMNDICRELFEALPNDKKNFTALRHLVAISGGGL